MKIFFDMDGTLSEFNKDAGPDVWSAPGYARGLPSLGSMTGAVKLMLDKPSYFGFKTEVYICSAVVSMGYAVEDKKFWLRHEEGLDIPDENLIFVPYGASKADAIKNAGVEIGVGDLFLDDYTKNLDDIHRSTILTAIKVLNGINDTHKSWTGERISAFSSPMAIYRQLAGINMALTRISGEAA